jgi:hypothetical protein
MKQPTFALALLLAVSIVMANNQTGNEPYLWYDTFQSVSLTDYTAEAGWASDSSGLYNTNNALRDIYFSMPQRYEVLQVEFQYKSIDTLKKPEATWWSCKTSFGGTTTCLQMEIDDWFNTITINNFKQQSIIINYSIEEDKTYDFKLIFNETSNDMQVYVNNTYIGVTSVYDYTFDEVILHGFSSLNSLVGIGQYISNLKVTGLGEYDYCNIELQSNRNIILSEDVVCRGEPFVFVPYGNDYTNITIDCQGNSITCLNYSECLSFYQVHDLEIHDCEIYANGLGNPSQAMTLYYLNESLVSNNYIQCLNGTFESGCIYISGEENGVYDGLVFKNNEVYTSSNQTIVMEYYYPYGVNATYFIYNNSLQSDSTSIFEMITSGYDYNLSQYITHGNYYNVSHYVCNNTIVDDYCDNVFYEPTNNQGFYDYYALTSPVQYIAPDTTPPSITNCSIDDAIIGCGESVTLTCHVNDPNLDKVIISITNDDAPEEAFNPSGDIYQRQWFNVAPSNESHQFAMYANDTFGNEYNYTDISIAFVEDCDACVPDWVCTGYAACNISNLRPCTSVNDQNACGQVYLGDYSEFTPMSCDFCVGLLTEINATECVSSQRYVCYIDLNFGSCCNVTQLPSDCFMGNLTFEQGCVFENCTSGYVAEYTPDDLPKIVISGAATMIIVISSFVGLIVLVLIWNYYRKRVKK